MVASTGVRIAIVGGLLVTAVLVYRYCHRGREGKKDRHNPRRDPPRESLRENFREPILPNYEKMVCDNEPRSNGSIYGECSHLMSGYPYYDKAY